MTEILDAPTTVPSRRPGRPSILVGLSFLVIALVVVCAIAGPALAPYSASAQDLTDTLAEPSAAHLLGTDDLGRDVFSRILAGAASALTGPLVIALGAMLIGSLLGLTAGYRGGFTETAIMRWVDLMYAVPQLLIAIVVVGVLSGTYWEAVLVLIVLTAPGDTRILRGAAIEQRGLPYVEALRVLGVPGPRILIRHVWPTLVPLSVAQTFLNFATSLVTLASLSFLGLGVAPGAADWGRMLAEGRDLVDVNPWTAIAPGLAIALTAASFNIAGDWLHERLAGRGKDRT
ncbi:ABC transporter permease subunit [Nonomuraea phyllanthi]|uniref:ABC transporter permease n=1 Tax=Nonomuraea phyllanthi TaxID=2219224 RepID=UPI0012935827|nr:ABC transporter permease [Nonomuraea phyllanthi]QFY11474.1 ABC transporter permease subunit [Nonomuraea phyllanthi]